MSFAKKSELINQNAILESCHGFSFLLPFWIVICIHSVCTYMFIEINRNVSFSQFSHKVANPMVWSRYPLDCWLHRSQNIGLCSKSSSMGSETRVQLMPQHQLFSNCFGSNLNHYPADQAINLKHFEI